MAEPSGERLEAVRVVHDRSDGQLEVNGRVVSHVVAREVAEEVLPVAQLEGPLRQVRQGNVEAALPRTQRGGQRGLGGERVPERVDAERGGDVLSEAVSYVHADRVVAVEARERHTDAVGRGEVEHAQCAAGARDAGVREECFRRAHAVGDVDVVE